MSIRVSSKARINAPPLPEDSLRIFKESVIEPVCYTSGLGLNYVQRGEIRTTINDQMVSLSSGELILMLPGSNTSFSSRGRVSGLSITFSSYSSILPANIEVDKEVSVSRALHEAYLLNKTTNNSKLKKYFDSLIDRPIINEEQAFQESSEFIKNDISYYYSRLSLINRKRINTRLNVLYRVEGIKQFIEENCIQKFDLDTLSRSFGMSKFALIRNFKEAFHTTPYQYYIRRKIRIAKMMLEKGLSIKETSQHCGYPDIFSFSKQFKLTLGCSPGKIV